MVQQVNKPLSTTNRNKLKEVFITFPKSNIEKDELKLPSYSYAAVCKELHQDGTPHLHAVVRLDPPIAFSKIRKFYDENYPDDCKRIHYSKVYSSIHYCLDYMQKEDEAILEYGQRPAKRERKLRSLPALIRYFGNSPQRYRELVLEMVEQGLF